MRINFFAVVLPLCLMCSLASAQTTPSGATDTLPTWTASDAQLQTLSAEVSKPSFSIRPPSDFNEVPAYAGINSTTSRGTQRGYVWQGPQNDAGTYPVLTIRTIVLTTKGQATITAQGLMKGELARTRAERKDFVESKIEGGLINGTSCARAYWRGTFVDPHFASGVGKATRGFIYVSWNFQTNTIIFVDGSDIDPYYAQTSKELEAAALTLKPN